MPYGRRYLDYAADVAEARDPRFVALWSDRNKVGCYGRRVIVHDAVQAHEQLGSHRTLMHTALSEVDGGRVGVHVRFALRASGLTTVMSQMHWAYIIRCAPTTKPPAPRKPDESLWQVKRLGIPDSNIILMLPDDIPCNPRNPYPGSMRITTFPFARCKQAMGLASRRRGFQQRGQEAVPVRLER